MKSVWQEPLAIEPDSLIIVFAIILSGVVEVNEFVKPWCGVETCPFAPENSRLGSEPKSGDSKFSPTVGSAPVYFRNTVYLFSLRDQVVEVVSDWGCEGIIFQPPPPEFTWSRRLSQVPCANPSCSRFPRCYCGIFQSKAVDRQPTVAWAGCGISSFRLYVLKEKVRRA